MRTFVGEVPISVLAIATAIVIAYAGRNVVARWLGTSSPIAAFLLFGFGLVISATLVPTADAMAGVASTGACDLSRMALPPLQDLTRVNFTSLNVLLFIPLGSAIGLLPWNRATRITIVAAVSLPFVVETLQLLLPVLGRRCETADMIDNLLGLGLGLMVGILARPLVRRR